jgi:hypothetical protein
MRVRLFICVLLFIVPFFWFKPGEMDIGGDSSRLYMYDPQSFLQIHGIYTISPSGIGPEQVDTYNAPYVFSLLVLKKLVGSPTLLISIMYGLTLSLSFLFTSLAVKRLLLSEANEADLPVEIASIVSGIFYAIAPNLIVGWDKPILTHVMLFLNPMVFYLLLRYFQTTRFYYLIIVLLTSFVFAPAFSYVAAPKLISFYFSTGMFFLIYRIAILRKSIPWSHLVLALCLFVSLHMLHLGPFIPSFFSPGNPYETATFSSQGKYDRGLSYFSAVAPQIKISLNIFGLPQLTNTSLFGYGFVIMFVIIVLGIMSYRSKKGQLQQAKLLYATSILFIGILFFSSANITDIGMRIYRKLFDLPGFSMFRNFYGQWAYTYTFYFVLLFGLAFGLLGQQIGKTKTRLIGIFIAAILLGYTAPFLKGDMVRKTLWQTSNSQEVMTMDPDYVKTLEAIKSLPKTERLVQFPISDHGYQTLVGLNGGVYQGPSTISLLTGVSDFVGYGDFGKFSEPFLQISNNRDFNALNKLFGLLGIHYVFHNSDPAAYDVFSGFPYERSRQYLPVNQKEYKQFITDLGAKTIVSIGNKYTLYELPRQYQLPMIYAVTESVASPVGVDDWTVPISLVHDTNSYMITEGVSEQNHPDTTFQLSMENNIFSAFSKNTDPPRILYPSFAYIEPKSWLYFFTYLKEKLGLWKLDRNNVPMAIDRRLFLSAKRIFELERWGDVIPVSGQNSTFTKFDMIPEKDKIRRLISTSFRNSWEGVFAQYVELYKQINWDITNAKMPENWKNEQRFLANEYLLQHRERVLNAISLLHKPTKQKEYLEKSAQELFHNLFTVIEFKLPSFHSITYRDLTKSNFTGEDLEIYIKEYDALLFQKNGVQVRVGDSYYPVVHPDYTRRKGYGYIGTVRLDSGKPATQVSIELDKPDNMLGHAQIESLDNLKVGTDSANLTLKGIPHEGKTGVVWLIDDWLPDKYYVISYEYKVGHEPFVMRLIENRIHTDKTGYSTIPYVQKLVSKEWESVEFVVHSAQDATSLYFQLNNVQPISSQAIGEIRNVQVTPVSYPEIIFTSPVMQKQSTPKAPLITFQKIDPVTYKVHVSDATDPYNLVLNQAYGVRWNVYLDKAQNTNIFQRIIQIMNQKPIAVDSHKLANGFANSWVITPEDIGRVTQYDLTITLTTQLYVYLGALLSGLTILILFVLFLASRYHEKNK